MINRPSLSALTLFGIATVPVPAFNMSFYLAPQQNY